MSRPILRNKVTVSSNSFGVSSTFAPFLRTSLRWMSISKGGKESCLVSSRGYRSEEHTSELQSLTNLVCRLLLEKKKESRDQLSVATSTALTPHIHVTT